jgi:hypothetical protein
MEACPTYFSLRYTDPVMEAILSSEFVSEHFVLSFPLVAPSRRPVSHSQTPSIREDDTSYLIRFFCLSPVLPWLCTESRIGSSHHKLLSYAVTMVASFLIHDKDAVQES